MLFERVLMTLSSLKLLQIPFSNRPKVTNIIILHLLAGSKLGRLAVYWWAELASTICPKT